MARKLARKRRLEESPLKRRCRHREEEACRQEEARAVNRQEKHAGAPRFREPPSREHARLTPRAAQAFTFTSSGRLKRERTRAAEKEQRRLHVPVAERLVDDPPPFVVLVHGPPQSGKSTLIKSLVKHYTRQNLFAVKGPITVVSGKSRRLQFVECGPELANMVSHALPACCLELRSDALFLLAD